MAKIIPALRYNSKLVLNIGVRFVPLIYISLGSMISIYSTKIPFIDWVRLFTSICGAVGLFFVVSKGTKFILLKLLNLFVLVILPPTILYYFVFHTPTSHSVLDIGDSILWVSVFFIFFWQGYRCPQTISVAKNIALLIPIYAIVFYQVRMFLIFEQEDTAMISMAYYPLFLMPFVLLLDNKKVRLIFLFIIFATILLSGKRAGFIAFVLSIITYVITKLRYSKKHHSVITIILITAIGLFFFIIFMIYFIETNDLIILDRLYRLNDDEGSGRSDIYAHTWEMIKSSNIIAIIFGHGFNTVYNDSVLNLSAHTDTLEVIYDYGIIGSIVYLSIIYKIFIYGKEIKKYTLNIYPAYLTSLILFVVLSFFAHLVIYPSHFLYVCAFWGIVIGQCEEQRRIQHVQ